MTRSSSPPAFALRMRPVRAVWASRCAARPRPHAEKADREKNIEFQGDTGGGNAETKTGELVGHVIITQGTHDDPGRPRDVQAECRQLVVGDGLRQPGALSRKARWRRRLLRRLRAAHRLRRREALRRALRQRVAEEGRRRDSQQLHLLQRRDREFLRGRPPGREAAGRRRRAAGRARARHVPAQERDKADKPAAKDKDADADAGQGQGLPSRRTRVRRPRPPRH